MKPLIRLVEKCRNSFSNNSETVKNLKRHPSFLFSQECGNAVLDVSVSSDGSYIAAGSSDKRIYLFDKKGVMVWGYNIRNTVYSVSMSSNASFIAASSDSNELYLFDRDGELQWKKNSGVVRGVALSSDGYYLATVLALKGWYEKIRLYRTSGKPVWSKKTGDYVWGVSVSSDGSYIAAGSSDKRIYLFNVKGELLWRYITSGNVMGVSISQNGYIAAGSFDGNVYFFKITESSQNAY